MTTKQKRGIAATAKARNEQALSSLNPESFAAQVKRARLRAKMTQEQFAVLAEIPVSTLRGYERGSREPLFGEGWRILACRRNPPAVETGQG